MRFSHENDVAEIDISRTGNVLLTGAISHSGNITTSTGTDALFDIRKRVQQGCLLVHFADPVAEHDARYVLGCV
ncbi:hypothetical protein GOFOIKOB_6135 [Methylobacterium tardum]|uniref:Uncharacterized protein n=1 Tax=Methylobacterium tardum TaxID=374432 RepID=A0AA37WPZ6_9HYPH|nr:hypothetical protein [Methylobacterium tardum]URD38740.1 hypothetical protein M6G65_10160 [Methylobacterium tardum]GJE53059.1 hypothetical protein GOFOIKOB_6135 [Methylobacterium tardum]GLS68739.1 hypothetical protein GCM10007890_07510 [Methylobacterium tardum]